MSGLVLSRKEDESVVMSDCRETIRVSVVEIRQSKVRLRFEAGDGVKIIREELLPVSKSLPEETNAAEENANV